MRAKTVNQFQKVPLSPKSMGVGMDANIDAFLKNHNPNFSLASNPAEALAICAVKNRINYVDYLLDSGMDVHINDEHALKVTAFHEKYEMAKHLISRGADLKKAIDSARQEGLNRSHRNLINLWSMLKNQGIVK